MWYWTTYYLTFPILTTTVCGSECRGTSFTVPGNVSTLSSWADRQSIYTVSVAITVAGIFVLPPIARCPNKYRTPTTTTLKKKEYYMYDNTVWKCLSVNGPPMACPPCQYSCLQRSNAIKMSQCDVIRRRMLSWRSWRHVTWQSESAQVSPSENMKIMFLI